MNIRKKKSRKLRKINTDKQENDLRELLIDIVDEKGFVSKYVLEGHLLYTLGCDNIQMYNVLMNLTNNEELCLIQLKDGEYYQFHPKI